MEKKVNAIINKIMESNKLTSNDLNKIIELHECISGLKAEYQLNNENNNGTATEPNDLVFDIQLKRLEMALKDKIKQINIYLNDDYLDYFIRVLLYQNGKPNVRDLRLINKYEIAIIRENEIELGFFSHNVDNFSAGPLLEEEAYFQGIDAQSKKTICYDPKYVFSSFYKEMDDKINNLKEKLGIFDTNVAMYFDKDLDDFYFNYPPKINVILTMPPSYIEIYEVDTSRNEWMPKKISGDSVNDYLNKINYSLLEESSYITEHKQRYKESLPTENYSALTIEMALENFKNSPFNLEILIQTYIGLFNNNNCMLEENERLIERLMYLAIEKYLEQGVELKKAINYIVTIFNTIKSYKEQIIMAINGNNTFPQDSLICAVRKLENNNK